MRRWAMLRIALAVVVMGGMLQGPLAFADNDRHGDRHDGRHDDDRGKRGALFVMTNSADRDLGNEIVMYSRDSDGDLSLIGRFPTGRLGDIEDGPQRGSGPAPTARIFNLATGGGANALPLVSAQFDGLGSANSLILNDDNRCLFAVNAGDNSVSSFRVHRNRLDLVSIVASGGVFPASLAEHDDVLYVLNSGDTGALAGFRVRDNCRLVPIANSSRHLGPAGLNVSQTFDTPAPGEVLTTPAQISFTPDGRRLILSIKGLDGANFAPGSFSLPNGRMVVFPVADGLLGAPGVTNLSFAAGTGGPFSFVFASSLTRPHLRVIVIHANSGTVAQYAINTNHTLSLIGDPLTVSGFAGCWLDVSGRFGSSRYIYTASFGAPSGVLDILNIFFDSSGTPRDPLGMPLDPSQPDLNGQLNGFRFHVINGTLEALNGVSESYPDPTVALGVGPGEATGNHGIDMRIIDRFLYFLQPRVGRIGRRTINPNGSLTNPVDFGGLTRGLEPFKGLNPDINNFTERCFNPDSAPAPECATGSAQGIAGF